MPKKLLACKVGLEFAGGLHTRAAAVSGFNTALLPSPRGMEGCGAEMRSKHDVDQEVFPQFGALRLRRHPYSAG